MQVSAAVYTTFYIGALKDAGSPQDPTPTFEILFTVAYGLTRDKLEELNFIVKSSDRVQPQESAELPYLYHIYSGIARPGPSVLLKKPLAVEVMGASFTKEPRYNVRAS